MLLLLSWTRQTVVGTLCKTLMCAIQKNFWNWVWCAADSCLRLKRNKLHCLSCMLLLLSWTRQTVVGTLCKTLMCAIQKNFWNWVWCAADSCLRLKRNKLHCLSCVLLLLSWTRQTVVGTLCKTLMCAIQKNFWNWVWCAADSCLRLKRNKLHCLSCMLLLLSWTRQTVVGTLCKTLMCAIQKNFWNWVWCAADSCLRLKRNKLHCLSCMLLLLSWTRQTVVGTLCKTLMCAIQKNFWNWVWCAADSCLRLKRNKLHCLSCMLLLLSWTRQTVVGTLCKTLMCAIQKNFWNWVWCAADSCLRLKRNKLHCLSCMLLLLSWTRQTVVGTLCKTLIVRAPFKRTSEIEFGAQPTAAYDLSGTSYTVCHVCYFCWVGPDRRL